MDQSLACESRTKPNNGDNKRRSFIVEKLKELEIVKAGLYDQLAGINSELENLKEKALAKGNNTVDIVNKEINLLQTKLKENEQAIAFFKEVLRKEYPTDTIESSTAKESVVSDLACVDAMSENDASGCGESDEKFKARTELRLHLLEKKVASFSKELPRDISSNVESKEQQPMTNDDLYCKTASKMAALLHDKEKEVEMLTALNLKYKECNQISCQEVTILSGKLEESLKARDEVEQRGMRQEEALMKVKFEKETLQEEFNVLKDRHSKCYDKLKEEKESQNEAIQHMRKQMEQLIDEGTGSLQNLEDKLRKKEASFSKERHQMITQLSTRDDQVVALRQKLADLEESIKIDEANRAAKPSDSVLDTNVIVTAVPSTESVTEPSKVAEKGATVESKVEVSGDIHDIGISKESIETTAPLKVSSDEIKKKNLASQTTAIEGLVKERNGIESDVKVLIEVSPEKATHKSPPPPPTPTAGKELFNLDSTNNYKDCTIDDSGEDKPKQTSSTTSAHVVQSGPNKDRLKTRLATCGDDKNSPTSGSLQTQGKDFQDK